MKFLVAETLSYRVSSLKIKIKGVMFKAINVYTPKVGRVRGKGNVLDSVSLRHAKYNWVESNWCSYIHNRQVERPNGDKTANRKNKIDYFILEQEGTHASFAKQHRIVIYKIKW